MKLTIARVGKTVGLHGDLKLRLDTDFPEQFKKGATFQTDIGTLEIEQYAPQKNIVKFRSYNTIDEAKTLTNLELYTTREQTKKSIALKKDEHFWFDIIDCTLSEGTTTIGKVEAIERFSDIDYLKITLEPLLAKLKKQKRVLVPYNNHYIQEADTQNKTISGKNILLLLDA